MRVPDFRYFTRFARFFGIFCAGMIVGSALFMAVYHHNFNLLFTVNDSLQAEIKQLQEENENLKQYNNNNTVIKSIYIDIERNPDEEPLNEVIKNQLTSAVKEELKILIGQSISLLDQISQTSRTLFGRKLYTDINDKDYIVEIKSMLVIYSELKVWISVREFQRNS